MSILVLYSIAIHSYYVFVWFIELCLLYVCVWSIGLLIYLGYNVYMCVISSLWDQTRLCPKCDSWTLQSIKLSLTNHFLALK